MGDKHVVRFEPVGIEIEVDEDQTILRAAAENGVQLMHGCKEGQCASCKSFVLEGEDIEYDRYSTFALPDYERDEGMTLLCRAHAYEDVVIELLNYDEEMIRSGLPLVSAVAEVVANEPVTHDLRRLVIRLVETEERIARPSEPPTCRVVLSSPEASPDSAGATPVVAAIVTPTNDSPSPAPMMVMAGRTWLA